MSSWSRRFVAVASVMVVAGCGGSSKKHPSASTTTAPGVQSATTALAHGSDQKATAFCQTMLKLNAITDPSKDSAAQEALLVEGLSEAPPEIHDAFQALTDIYRSAAHPDQTTTSIDATFATKVQEAGTAVNDYVVGHCGVQ